MRKLLACILLLASNQGDATTRGTVIDSQCDVDRETCLKPDLARLFKASDVVFEVTPRSARKPWPHGDRTTIDAQQNLIVHYVWKNDRGTIGALFTTRGSKACGAILEPNVPYIVFAKRMHGRLCIEFAKRAEDFEAHSTTYRRFYAARREGDLEALLLEYGK